MSDKIIISKTGCQVYDPEDKRCANFIRMLGDDTVMFVNYLDYGDDDTRKISPTIQRAWGPFESNKEYSIKNIFDNYLE